MLKLIVANWKMHPQTVSEAIALAREEDIDGFVIAPPVQFISDVSRVLEHATLGAQDYSEHLQPLGVQYVIIGHSDRRAQGETDEAIAKKMKLVLEQGMTPILCVGESAIDRAAGRAKEVVREQLRLDLADIRSVRRQLLAASCKLAIAYEPIWAISTNPNATPDTPDNAAHMIHLIYKELRVLLPQWNTKVLYGGSVDEYNAESFLAKPEIDGCLIGGASLRSEAIKKIMKIAKK